jgi:Reverse transcriptase (RNA-dependent DNA polymerase)
LVVDHFNTNNYAFRVTLPFDDSPDTGSIWPKSTIRHIPSTASEMKMSTLRTLVPLTLNDGWKLHQLDVKNVFLHKNLLKEMYVEIPPGFDTNQTVEKVCKLRKANLWVEAVSSSLI